MAIDTVRTGMLAEATAAAMLGFKPDTLRAWRCRKRPKGQGALPHYRIGNRVFYKGVDLVEWIESRRITGKVTK